VLAETYVSILRAVRAADLVASPAASPENLKKKIIFRKKIVLNIRETRNLNTFKKNTCFQKLTQSYQSYCAIMYSN